MCIHGSHSHSEKKKDNCRYDNTSTIIIDYYERYHNWVKVITGFIQYWKVIEFAWSPLNNFTYVMPCFWTSNIMWETCLVQFLWSSAAVSWGVTCALHNRKYGNLSNFHSYLEFFNCPWKEFKSWFAVQPSYISCLCLPKTVLPLIVSAWIICALYCEAVIIP